MTNWYVLHHPTQRLSDAFSSPEAAAAGAKLLGSRNAKLVRFGSFSGFPLFASKTGWMVIPESYLMSLQDVGSAPRGRFDTGGK